jgi:hypothetical protein
VGTHDLDGALRRVEWMRAPDRWSMILATDFLARSFTWQAPGLAPPLVTKLPFLNCSTTVVLPALVRTVKSRSNVSSAQSFTPHVPESGEPLVYGP